MPGKYSEDDKHTESYISFFEQWEMAYWQFIDKKRSLDSLIMVNKLQSQKMKLYDVNHIKSDYLINNIEKSFEVWYAQPWGNDIPFDIFCEEILPYRIGT